MTTASCDQSSSTQLLTLPLDSPRINLSNAGGKGTNLSILSRYHDGGNNSNSNSNSIRVPPGFVITTTAYEEFINQNDGAILREIEKELANLTNTSTSRNNKEDDSTTRRLSAAHLEATSASIRASFHKYTLPSDLQFEIEQRLTDLFPTPQSQQPQQYQNQVQSHSQQQIQYFAIRSSATCEDAPTSSFAGQHDTYLNIPLGGVCDRVMDCFASLFTSRAISYRFEQQQQQNQIQMQSKDSDKEHDMMNVSMAVVVQAMATQSTQQHSSGVLFTANPLTGRRNESVLEAIPGLGEALVSGLTEPDRYVVRRKQNDEMEIVDKRIGSKAMAIRSVEGGGVIEEDTTAAVATSIISQESTTTTAKATATVLTDKQVKQIIQRGQQIEQIFHGTPQDIEWAQSEEGEVYIVQSRPITTLFPLPNVPSDPLKVYFSFNAIQGIVAPIYPAGQDALRKGILGGLLRWISWGRFGNEGIFLQPCAERLYIDVTNLIRNSLGRKLWCNVLLPSIEPGFLVGIKQLLGDPDLSVNSGMNFVLILRLLSLALVIVPRFILSILFPNWSRKRIVHRIERFVDEAEAKIEATQSLSEIVALESEVFGSFFPMIIPHLIPRFAAAMGPLALLTHLATSIPNGKDLVLTITRGLHHNVTTEMDLKLWQVAKTIQSDPCSLKYFTSSVNNADTLASDYLCGKLPNLAQSTICQFMNDYGMRGLYEIDFGRPRWREEPAPLMNTLKSFVQIFGEEHAPDKVFAAGEVAAQQAIDTLGKQLGRPWLVSFLASRTRSLAGLRELPKFTIIRIMGMLRAKILREGAKLVELGVIDDIRDLFFLYIDELESLAKGDLNDCKSIILERKAAFERESRRCRLPRVIASDGFAYYGGSASASSSANIKEGSNALCGEPVSPGTYEGRIRIIHDPSKSKISQGEILCCHGTDPSWTPLFLSAGALVMEVGGLMTHGSVVAREYGIPAVVGLEKVTERLVTGQLVRVDGSTGFVEILGEDGEGDLQKGIDS